MSIDSIEPPKAKQREANLIQLELITLDSVPAPNLSLNIPKPTNIKPEKKNAELIEVNEPPILTTDLNNIEIEPSQIKPTAVPLPATKLPETQAEQTIDKTTIKEQKLVVAANNDNAQPESENTDIPIQKLVIEELQKIDKKTTEEQPDLTALIRAVTEQFNKDQAQQQRETNKQENRTSLEQAQLQTAEVSLNKTEEQVDIQDTVNFLEEQASWLDKLEPNTSIPQQVWHHTNANTGDFFIVILELHVDKEGHITQVQLSKSSGNPIIDAIAAVQVRAGQLTPFQHNGLAVNGIVPMTLRYEMP